MVRYMSPPYALGKEKYIRSPMPLRNPRAEGEKDTVYEAVQCEAMIGNILLVKSPSDALNLRQGLGLTLAWHIRVGAIFLIYFRLVSKVLSIRLRYANCSSLILYLLMALGQN